MKQALGNSRKRYIMDVTFSKRRMVVIILALLFFLPTVSVSQNSKIDSLNQLLSIKTGTEYIDLLFELSRAYGDMDMGQTLKYANEAFQLSYRAGDSLRIVKTGRLRSQALRETGKIDSSLILYYKILPIAKRHNYSNEVKAILNGLGGGYSRKANYDKALKCYFESLDLREKDGDKFEISIVLNNIGLVYSALEDYDKALSYYKQALQLRIESNNNWGLDILLFNISLCYGLKNNFSEARNFLELGLSTCGKSCNEESLLFGKYIFGLISFGHQNFSEAEMYFLESYALSKKIGDEFQLSNIYYLLRIYIHSNQLSLAEKYLKEAELLIASGPPDNDEIIEIYAQLFSMYSKTENFEKVAFYQNKYITLKDSIYNKSFTTNLMKVEAEYLDKVNKAKIDVQNKILALNREVISRQKIVNASVGIISLLGVILAIVLAKSNRQKRIANRLLDEKVKERTHELQLNQDALQRAWQERDALIYKASADIKGSIATIKGLCFLGKKDIDHPNAGQYLDKMDSTSDYLSEIINRMFYAYRIDTPSK